MKKYFKVYIFLIFSMLLCFLTYTTYAYKLTKKVLKHSPVKNIILFIGDGMGYQYLTAYRFYKNRVPFKNVGLTSLDKYLVGSQMTYPFDNDENITDSAASATAMATGYKTYNGYVGVNEKLEPKETVLERAKKLGKSTGLVVTVEVNHATPACFVTHVKSRKLMDLIADNYCDEKILGKNKVDIILGGGKKHFLREDRNLIKDFIKRGYTFLDTREELLQACNTKNNKLLGLFADEALPKAIDRLSDIPSLKEMTQVALSKLKNNNKGFFLLVEGSQIDSCGHKNDIVGAMSEMKDFEEAFEVAVDFALKDKKTLVVATADHSTGGLSLGKNKNYYWNPFIIKKVLKTPYFIADMIAKGCDTKEALEKYISFPLTSKEISSVEKAAKDSKAAAILEIIDKRTNTGWTTIGHTGEDVPVFALGPNKDMFRGFHDNTWIAKCFFKLLF